MWLESNTARRRPVLAASAAIVALVLGVVAGLAADPGTSRTQAVGTPRTVTVTAEATVTVQPSPAIRRVTATATFTRVIRRTVTAKPRPPAAPAARHDPRFNYCYQANAAGYGPYYQGRDPEYYWYRDANSDGIVCET